jgi:hypothetical protein
MPPERSRAGGAEFEALVLRIARTKVRWAEAGYRD